MKNTGPCSWKLTDCDKACARKTILWVGVRPLFHKTAGHHVRSGDKHLLRACDFNRSLERREVQKAVREYSKALNTFLEDKRKHQERFEKYVLKRGGRFPKKRDERAPHMCLKLGQWPYKSCLSFSAIRPLDEGMIFARKVLAHFLDGQYDQVNYVVEEAGYHLASYGAERDLLWARILAAKGIYEDSLIRYSEITENTYKRVELQGAGEIEQAALQCMVGHMKKAEYLLTDYVWPRSRELVTDNKIFFVENFEEEAKRKGQEVLFPLNPKGTLGLIFFIALRSLDAPPIVRIRTSVDLANAAIEVTRQIGGENKLNLGPHARNLAYYPMPFLTGVMFSLNATSEQASNFITEMRARSVIERLECFGVFSDPLPFKPISDEEHADLMLRLAEKSLVFGQFRWAKGSCARSQSTVSKEKLEHNDAIKKSAYCLKCRRAKSKYESMMVW